MTKNDFNVTLTGPEIDLGAATEQEKQESLGGFDPYATEPETSPIYTQPDKTTGFLERIRLESEKRTGVETTIPRALGRLVGSVLFGGDERKVEQKNALTDLAKGEWLADDWSKLGPMAPGTPGGVTAVPKIRVDFRTAAPQQIEGMVKFAGLDSDQIGKFFEERLAWEKANGETRDPRDVLADVVSAEAENTLRQRVHVSSRAAAALPEGGKNEKGFGYSFLGGGLMNLPYMGTYALSYATGMGPTLPLLASYDRRLQANREDQLGFTEEGDLGVVKPGMTPEEAELKAWFGAAKETAIEIAGGKVVGLAGKGLGILGKWLAKETFPTAAAAVSKVGRDVLRNSPALRKFTESWKAASEITQVQRYPDEVAEEWSDNMLDAIFQLDPKAPEGDTKWKRFVAANKEFKGQLGDILLTLAFIQGPQAITAGAKTVGYAQKEKAAERGAAEWLKVAGVSDEQAKEILANGDARAAVEYVVADETRRKEIAKRVSDRSARIADDLLKTNEWMEDGGGKNAVSRFVPPTPADLKPGEDGVARYESSGVGIEYDAPNSRIAITDTRTGRQAFVFGGQTPAEGMEQAFAIADAFDKEAQGRDAVNAKKRELLAKALEARGVDGTYVFVEKPEQLVGRASEEALDAMFQTIDMGDLPPQAFVDTNVPDGVDAEGKPKKTTKTFFILDNIRMGKGKGALGQSVNNIVDAATHEPVHVGQFSPKAAKTFNAIFDQADDDLRMDVIRYGISRELGAGAVDGEVKRLSSSTKDDTAAADRKMNELRRWFAEGTAYLTEGNLTDTTTGAQKLARRVRDFFKAGVSGVSDIRVLAERGLKQAQGKVRVIDTREQAQAPQAVEKSAEQAPAAVQPAPEAAPAPVQVSPAEAAPTPAAAPVTLTEEEAMPEPPEGAEPPPIEEETTAPAVQPVAEAVQAEAPSNVVGQPELAAPAVAPKEAVEPVSTTQEPKKGTQAAAGKEVKVPTKPIKPPKKETRPQAVARVKKALAAGEPVPAADIDRLGLKVPDTYGREGDNYVKLGGVPAQEQKPAETPAKAEKVPEREQTAAGKAPELMTPEEFAADTVSSGERARLGSRVTPKDARRMHKTYTEEGVDARKPVNASAVDTYGINLPEGYAREGDLYVFKPKSTTAKEAKDAEAVRGDEGQVREGKPRQGDAAEAGVRQGAVAGGGDLQLRPGAQEAPRGEQGAVKAPELMTPEELREWSKNQPSTGDATTYSVENVVGRAVANKQPINAYLIPVAGFGGVSRPSKWNSTALRQEGYVREGDLYVFKPEPTTPPDDGGKKPVPPAREPEAQTLQSKTPSSDVSGREISLSKIPKGARVATVKLDSGVSYRGEFVKDNGDGTATLRAFGEKPATGVFRRYGTDAKGVQIVKDVTVPLASVKSVEPPADLGKLTPAQRSAVRRAAKAQEAAMEAEIAAGETAGADVAGRMAGAEERRERARTDNETMFRTALKRDGYAETDNAFVTAPRFRIDAYHGSPHIFDKFDLSRIGTGEGTQAYGYGLYMAQVRDVAEGYRKQLSSGATTLDDRREMASQELFGKTWDELNGNERLSASKRAAQLKSGALYTVELDVDDADLLDWDAPLSQQSEKVRKALRNQIVPGDIPEQYRDMIYAAVYGNSTMSGRDLYNLLSGQILRVNSERVSNRNASEFLNARGIKGIRYFDAASRGRGEGTRNYVIFDDKYIKIVARNDQPAKGYGPRGETMFRVTPAGEQLQQTEGTENEQRNVADRFDLPAITLPDSIQREMQGGNRERLTEDLRRVHRQFQKDLVAQGENAGAEGREDLHLKLREKENEVIQRYVAKNGLAVEYSDFLKKHEAYKKKLGENGEEGGGGTEQSIYVVPGDPGSVIKVNNMSQHTSWLDFFNKIATHNFLFPETAYELVGFTRVTPFPATGPIGWNDIVYRPVLKQDFVAGENIPNEEDMKRAMGEKGFFPTSAEPWVYESEQYPGIQVTDLHYGNGVVKANGTTIIFDPMIRTTSEFGTVNFRVSQPVTPAEDAEYMAAVEAGDMNKAQSMVDEAAKRAGASDNDTRTKVADLLSQRGATVDANVSSRIYNSKILDPVVESIPVDVVDLFGSRQAATEMLLNNPAMFENTLAIAETNQLVRKSALAGFRDKAVRVATAIRTALADSAQTPFDRKVFAAMHALQNNLITTVRHQSAIGFGGGLDTFRGIENTRLAGDGITGGVAESPLTALNVAGEFLKLDATNFADAFRFHKTENSKSLKDAQGLSDPITRDDQGNVIPLSQRFNEATPDIRFRVSQTETPEFKRWFKDSKVVDADGKPLVVYHGTDNDFTEFKKTRDIGFHFGTSQQANYRFGGNVGYSVMPVYLKLTNPIRLKDHAWDTPESLYTSLRHLDGEGILASAMHEWKRVRDVTVSEGLEVEEYRKALSDKRDNLSKKREKSMSIARDLIKKSGFDGVVYKNEVEGAGDSYIAFRPEQIKSATGNVGTFDPTNPDIRFRVSQPQDAEDLARAQAQFAALRALMDKPPEDFYKAKGEPDTPIVAPVVLDRKGLEEIAKATGTPLQTPAHVSQKSEVRDALADYSEDFVRSAMDRINREGRPIETNDTVAKIREFERRRLQDAEVAAVEMDTAIRNGNVGRQLALLDEKEALVRDLDQAAQALSLVGSERGRQLAFLKYGLDRNLSIIYRLQRLRKATGAPVTLEQYEKMVAEMAKDRAEMKKLAEEHERVVAEVEKETRAKTVKEVEERMNKEVLAAYRKGAEAERSAFETILAMNDNPLGRLLDYAVARPDTADVPFRTAGERKENEFPQRLREIARAAWNATSGLGWAPFGVEFMKNAKAAGFNASVADAYLYDFARRMGVPVLAKPAEKWKPTAPKMEAGNPKKEGPAVKRRERAVKEAVRLAVAENMLADGGKIAEIAAKNLEGTEWEGISPLEVMEIVTGYPVQPDIDTRDELDRRVAMVRKHMLALQRLQELEQNKYPTKMTLPADKPDVTLRQLARELRDRMNDFQFPAGQEDERLLNAERALASRLRYAVEELQKAVDSGTPINEKAPRAVAETPEIAELRRTLKELRAAYEALPAVEAIKEARDAERARRAANKRYHFWQKRAEDAKNGIFPETSKANTAAERDAEAADYARKAEAARREYWAIKKASPQERVRVMSEKVAKAEERLADLEAKLALPVAPDLRAPKKPEAAPASPEEAALARTLAERRAAIERVKKAISARWREENADAIAAVKEAERYQFLVAKAEMLEDRIRRGDFSKAPVRPRVWSARVAEVDRKVRAGLRAINERIEWEANAAAGLGGKIKNYRVKGREVYKFFKTAGDLSAVGVQSARLFGYDPIYGTKLIWETAKNAWTDEAALMYQEEMHNDVDYDIAFEAGLALDQNYEDIFGTGMGESFVRDLERWGTGPGKGVGKRLVGGTARVGLASQRAFEMYGRMIRFHVFKSIINDPAHANLSKDELRTIANMVNIMGGVGNTKFYYRDIASVMSRLMWSSRLFTAQWQTLTGGGGLLWNAGMARETSRAKLGRKWYQTAAPGALKLYSRSLAGTFALSQLFGSIGMLLGDRQPWEDEETMFWKAFDFLFGRRVIGSKSIDTFGGLTSYTALVKRAFKGSHVTMSGKTQPDDDWKAWAQTMANFARGRLRPDISLALSAVFGEDVTGQPFGPRGGAEGMKNLAIEAAFPITPGDMQETVADMWATHGVVGVTAGLVPALASDLFGFSKGSAPRDPRYEINRHKAHLGQVRKALKEYREAPDQQKLEAYQALAVKYSFDRGVEESIAALDRAANTADKIAKDTRRPEAQRTEAAKAAKFHWEMARDILRASR